MNHKKILVNYTRIVVIAHGKCEKIMASYIKSNLHLPMGIESENNGSTSVQVDGLLKILENTVFKNKKSLKQKYEIEEDEEGNLKNFYLMPIMDLDDTENVQSYKNKEMFKGHWLYPYICPIWSNKTLDEALLLIGLIDKLPSKKEKIAIYSKIFSSRNNGGIKDIERIEEMSKKFEKSNKTNLDVFMKACLEWAKEQNK